MLVEPIKPRFCETDAVGHINNVTYAIWMEQGRTSFLGEVMPAAMGNIILAKVEINYLDEGFFGELVEVHTGVTCIGESSVTLSQKIYQGGRQISDGGAVVVYFDHKTKTSKRLPDDFRRALEAHLIG